MARTIAGQMEGRRQLEDRSRFRPPKRRRNAVDREDLSKPPSDAVLLGSIVQDVLSSYPMGSILKMSVLVKLVGTQSPDTVTDEQIISVIVSKIRDHGFAVQFDKG